jgi:hypothetical protein
MVVNRAPAEDVLKTIDVELMPRWSREPGPYPRPVNEPPRRVEVRVVFSGGLYGYEIEHGGLMRFDFFGGSTWRDRETAIAFCESKAHDRIGRDIGLVRSWVERSRT